MLFGRIQVEHEVKDLLLHKVRGAILLVHLVDDHNGFQSQFDGLAQHKSRLWHGPLKSIHHEEHSIGHFQHALNLAPKVRVTGGVDEVDFDIVPRGADILGQNGDAPLAFEVVVVEDEFASVFSFVNDVALVDDLVDEGGLAMVDVGDDGHVADSAHEVGGCGRKGRSPKNSLVESAAQIFEPESW